MAQTRTLQRRVRSVKNAKQITKALEVVAASRMRRVVGLVQGSRAYGDLAASLMRKIVANPEAKNYPFFSPPADKPTLYVVITSDRGQAGAFNSNIFNLAIPSFQSERQQPQVVVFGRKGARFFSHLAGIQLVGTYENIPDNPDVNVFAPLIDLIEQGTAEARFGKVVIIYTEFVSSLVQKAKLFQFLPIDLETAAVPETEGELNRVYEFEPDTTDVLEEAIRLYAAAKLMQARIESAASEHAMRMIAMGNANRNATDLIDDLTLELNATRQAAITQEIAEITGGAAAIAA
jgi:F-type H+-transporting ATPase subunit gamma